MSLESLEQRILLASDVMPVANVFWKGQQVTARADAWVVTTDSRNAPPVVPAGWTRASLGGGYYAVRAPGSSANGMTSWASAAGVRSIEPDRIITTAQVANDPSFRSLWGLDNTGQTGGVTDADIDAPEAWDITTGSRAAVVAVIDTGIDYRHPDLAANMWRNPGETAGDGIDNDRNGFVDDVYGWDFANNDADPFDDNGHGTHCAGTIGAVGNNGVGVTGVNWQVSLMALKFMSSTGSGTSSAAIAAINYATMMRRNYGINIVATSNSWGGGGASTTMQNAIVEGGNAGILFVAAAGNSASNNDATPSYPASYTSDAVIAVAATDSSNRLASFSSYGATSVDVGAPGVGIYSTVPNGGYATYSGTSMATPHVAGAVALMAAANPQATAAQIRATLFSTAVTTTSLSGKVATGGLLNVAAAVAAIRGTTPEPGAPAAPSGLAARATSSTQVELTWADNSTNETSFRIERRSGSAGSWSEIATVDPNVTRFTNTGLTAGTTYAYRIRAAAGTVMSAYSNESSVTPTPAVVNDSFANARVIGGTTVTVTGTNVGATKETGEPNHAGNSGGKSVWWAWTAPASGSFRMTTVGSTFDTTLAVYTGSSVSSLTHIASNDDGGGNLASLVNFTAVGGRTYRIAVDGYGGASGNITLNVAVTATTPAAPSGLAARATSSTQMELTWADNSTNETSFRIERRSGSAGSWSEIATVGANVTRFTNTGLTAGTTYAYRVRAAAGTVMSAYSNESSATTPTAVVNDNFSSATPISGTTVTVTGTNGGATKETGEPNHAGNSGGKSVWWAWTAPTSGSFRMTTVGSTFDTVLAVYTGSSVSSLTHIASNDDGGGNLASLVNFTAVGGRTYRIAVDGYGGASGNITLNVAVTATTPAAPSGLAARATSSTQMELTWADNSTNETSFRIERRSGSAGSWSEIATVNANVTRFTNTGLTAGTTYAYRVRAASGTVMSAYSNESIATMPTDGSTLVFGFRHVNEAGAEQYLVDSTGMRKYSEWQSPPITYWGPTANNAEGRLVYRVPFTAPAARIRLSAHSPTWDFFTEPGGSGRGASSLEVSRDGTTWVSLIDNLTPRRWGGDWTFNDVLPSSVAGGTEVWVRMRFLVESAPNSSYTVAQFGRSTSAASANVFEVRTEPTNQSPGASQAAVLGSAVASMAASPVSAVGSGTRPRRSTSGL